MICSHKFCFDCLVVQSGACPFLLRWPLSPIFYCRTIQTVPLFAQNIGDHRQDPPHSHESHGSHHDVTTYDSQKHFLPPLYIPSPSYPLKWSAYCCHTHTPRSVGYTKLRCARRGRGTRTHDQ